MRWRRDRHALRAHLAGSAAAACCAAGPAWAGGEGFVDPACGALGGGERALFVWRSGRRVGCGRVAGLLIGFGYWRGALLTFPAGLPLQGAQLALQFPGARIESQRWNCFSRIDSWKSAGSARSPGLLRLLGCCRPEGVVRRWRRPEPGCCSSPAILSQEAASSSWPYGVTSLPPRRMRCGPRRMSWLSSHGAGWRCGPRCAGGGAGDRARPIAHRRARGGSTPRRRSAVIEEPRSFVRRTDARYDVVG